ncbi:hypothetical protein VTO42DRAFT_6401 [Malbranchea cinnamomea]
MQKCQASCPFYGCLWIPNPLIIFPKSNFHRVKCENNSHNESGKTHRLPLQFAASSPATTQMARQSLNQTSCSSPMTDKTLLSQQPQESWASRLSGSQIRSPLPRKPPGRSPMAPISLWPIRSGPPYALLIFRSRADASDLECGFWHRARW